MDCPICRRSFSSEDALQMHLELHHGSARYLVHTMEILLAAASLSSSLSNTAGALEKLGRKLTKLFPVASGQDGQDAGQSQSSLALSIGILSLTLVPFALTVYAMYPDLLQQGQLPGTAAVAASASAAVVAGAAAAVAIASERQVQRGGVRAATDAQGEEGRRAAADAQREEVNTDEQIEGTRAATDSQIEGVRAVSVAARDGGQDAVADADAVRDGGQEDVGQDAARAVGLRMLLRRGQL